MLLGAQLASASLFTATARWPLMVANQAAIPVASLPSQLKTRRFLFELDTVLDHGHAGSI